MRINIRVIPRSRRNMLGWEQNKPGVLKAHITAPPVEGAANAALIALLANHLAIPRSAITIVYGATGRHKVVDIAGIDLAYLVKSIQSTGSFRL